MSEEASGACLPCRAEIRDIHAMEMANGAKVDRLYDMLDRRVGQLIDLVGNVVQAKQEPNKTAHYAVVVLLAIVFGLLFGTDALTKAIAAVK